MTSRRGPLGALVLAGAAVVLAVAWAQFDGPTWLGVAAVALFAVKTALSWRPARPAGRAAGRGEQAGEERGEEAGEERGEEAGAAGVRLGVVVPVYNEDPAMLGACLASLLGQTYPLSTVVVVDDCSPDPRALAEARAWQERYRAAGVTLVVEAFDHNRGKRHALMRALDLQPGIDALLGVDSDTVLRPDAVARLVETYRRPGVTAVTGLVLALNYDRNLLTRLIDLRYCQAFLVDRGAQSRLGSMLCACGSLALYSARVLRKYRPDFLGQRFLGAPAVFGDDRRLTNYCLLEGRAVLDETAVAFTAVPERLGHFLRQQIRWNKSFFRESVWVLRAMPLSKPAFWFTCAELAAWIVFTGTLIWALAVAPLVVGQAVLGPYLLYVALTAYARAFRYPDLTGIRPSARDRVIGFAIAPLYGLLHIGILVWLRLYSLATLRRGAWGTRRSVEVTLGGA